MVEAPDDLIAEVRDPTAPPREWTLWVATTAQVVGAGPYGTTDELVPVRVREVLDGEGDTP